MEQTKQTTKSPVVREYKIGDITYIVKAVVKDGVKEDAATKVRRLIHLNSFLKFPCEGES